MSQLNNLLTTRDVAAQSGTKQNTINSLIARGAMPKPDGYIGRTALWHINTITQWLASRPGTGHQWGDNLPEGNPEAAQSILDQYLTANQAGELLGTAPRNIQDRAKRGTLPAPVARLGNTWVWKKSDFDQHLPG